MDIPTIILSVAVIAVGVAGIAYILLRTPKTPARIGEPAEVTLGDAEGERRCRGHYARRSLCYASFYRGDRSK